MEFLYEKKIKVYVCEMYLNSEKSIQKLANNFNIHYDAIRIWIKTFQIIMLNSHNSKTCNAKCTEKFKQQMVEIY